MSDEPQQSAVSPPQSSHPPSNAVAQKEEEMGEEAAKAASTTTHTVTTIIKTPEHHAKILNINVGLLGHVDSGKTSLAKALSTIASTAAFDKNPQSVERGITLDLGFSSVVCDLVQQQSSVAVSGGSCGCGSRDGRGGKEEERHLTELFAPNALVGVRSHLTSSPYFIDRLPTDVYKRYVQEAGVSTVQLTLVDCPGHASLIRTIIGGASIVDVMILVIDATKGIQTQTAECIVLGEVLGRRLIIALNKVDMIQATGNLTEDEARKMMKKMMMVSRNKKKVGDKKEKKKDKKNKEEERSLLGGKKGKEADDEGKGEERVTKAGDTQEDGEDEDEIIEINEGTLKALERRKILDKIKKRLRAVFAQTKWPDVTFVEVAAAPGNNGARENNNDNALSLGERENDSSVKGGDTPVDLETDLAERIAEKKKLLNKEKKRSSKSKAKDKANEETSKDDGGDGTSTSHSPSSFNVKALIDAVLCAVDPLAIIHDRSVTGGAFVPSTASSNASNNATNTINTSCYYDNKRIPVDSNSMALLQNAAKKNFLMIVDHCFAVKGHGTVLTGTVASGFVAVGDDITLPELQLSKRVKSLQVFHEPVREAKQGDRVGLCVAGLDPSLLERGIICSSNALFLTNATATTTATMGGGGNDNNSNNSNSLLSSCSSPLLELLLSVIRSRHVDRIAKNISVAPLTPPPNVAGWGSMMMSVPQRLSAVQSTIIRSNCFIAAVRKVRYHEQALLTNSGASGTKYHITVGHSTEMGTLRYFSAPNPYYCYEDDDLYLRNDGKPRCSQSEMGLEDKEKDKKGEKKEKTSKKDKKDKHGTVANDDNGSAAREAALFNQQLKKEGPLAIEPSAILQRGHEASLVQLVDLLSTATAGGSGNGALSSGSKKGSASSSNTFPFGFAYEEELLDDPFSSEDENDEDWEEKNNTEEGIKKKKEAKKSKSREQEEDQRRVLPSSPSSSSSDVYMYVPPLLASAVAKPPRQRRRVMFALVQLDNPIVLSTSVSGETLARLCCSSPQISTTSTVSTANTLNTNNSNRSGAGARGGFVTHTPPILLASRFDTDLKSTTCRLAVEGSVVSVLADWGTVPQQGSGPQHTHTTSTHMMTTSGTNSIGRVGVPAPPEAIIARCKSSPNADDAFAIDILQHYLFTAYRRVFWRSLPISKPRSKVFMVDRIVDDHTCIVQVPPKPNAQSQQQQQHHQGDNTKTIAIKKGSQATAGDSGILLPHEVRDMSVFVKMKVFCVITTAPAEAIAEEQVAGENTTKGKAKKASATTAAMGPGTNIDVTGTSSPRVEWGVIEGPFGQNTNKLRVRFTNPVYRRQDTNGTSSTSQSQRVAVSREVVLPYQKYPFALHSPMAQ